MDKVCGFMWKNLFDKPTEIADKRIDKNQQHEEKTITVKTINKPSANKTINNQTINKPSYNKLTDDDTLINLGDEIKSILTLDKICMLMKKIGENEISKIYKVLVTSYYLYGQAEALKHLCEKIGCNGKYIICVGYKNTYGKLLDMQPGFTEKCKINELPEECARRGLGEECNGCVTVDDIEKISVPCIESKKQTIHHFSIPLSKVHALENFTKDINADDYAQRISVFPWGNKSEVESFLQIANVRDLSESIGYYVAVPIEHGIKMLELLKEQNTCGSKNTFVYTI